MSGTRTVGQRAVRWYPPAYDIRVEEVPIPKIEDPDDAIVRVQLAGLCGSDLHVYRGHEDVDSDIICGHEFIGSIIALGDSFNRSAAGRPELYSTLQVGDKVVSPFTVSCGECHFCRVGFTCRCIHATLFGIPSLPGGQAQYVRVPKAGGTLFRVSSIDESNSEQRPSDSSLLLLADILPTGVFAAIQAVQHAKTAPMLSGIPYPFSAYVPTSVSSQEGVLVQEDRVLTIAIVGLGPVGVCATISLLDMLGYVKRERGIDYRVIAIDPLEARRSKMRSILSSNSVVDAATKVVVSDIPEAKTLVREWTTSIGCNAVLEVVGNNNALILAYELVRPFGSISSVGVHQGPPLPYSGRSVYDKNVSLDFGRCPVRALLPIASKVLLSHQDVFGGVGGEVNLIEKIVGFDEAVQSYALFNEGKCGKILFDPWR